MKRLLAILTLAVAAGACSSSPPASSRAPSTPAPTPTPSALARVNPDIIEETEVHYIQRFRKSEYIRLDDRRIKHPLLASQLEFFKEDDEYYYVYMARVLPEERAKALEEDTRQRAARQEIQKRAEGSEPVPGPPLSDFEDLTPPRVRGGFRLEKVVSSGLPDSGLWRASFVLADMNGDGILDIVAPPSRIGPDPSLHIWLGDGRGGFRRWTLRYTETGKEKPDPGLDYGGVAVGDIDGDGKMDVVAASHGAGLASFFGDGAGGFRVDRRGLPAGEFSAQAIVLLDADGDRKLDIVASRDVVEQTPGEPVDKRQVRLYVYHGGGGWEFRPEALVGGFYSNSLHAWDYDGDRRKDILTGSHYSGALTMLWKNEGTASFSPQPFSEVEIYAYHFSTAPGTFGRRRVPAVADNFYIYTSEPEVARATGISLYTLEGENWKRRRVWRKKEGKSAQYALAMGDVSGDGLDDLIFPDSEERRLRIFLQRADETFAEVAQTEEPTLDSPGQCVRLGDLDGDGRLDVVVAKTVISTKPDDRGGWDVYLNRRN